MTRARLLKLVQRGYTGATNNELARLIGVSAVMVDKALRKLESEGKIRRQRIGRRRIILLL